MAPRSELTGLIEYVCRMVDPSGAVDIAPEVVADRLDAHAERHLGAALTAERNTLTGEVLAWVGPPGWDDDTTLCDATGAAVTPTGADPLAGRWTFATTHPATVHVIGTRYDTHAAAADLADTLAGQAARGIVSYTDAAGESWTRGDAAGAFRDIAARIRATMPVRSVALNNAADRAPGWCGPL